MPDTNIDVGQHFVYDLTVVDLNRVSVSGVNTVEFRRIDSPLLRVDLAGVINMTSVGTAAEQRVDIAGVATYQAGELESRVVRITAAGVDLL